MAEIMREPVKIVVGQGDDAAEYAAFDENHTWSDVARWVKSHSESDVEELIRLLGGEPLPDVS